MKEKYLEPELEIITFETPDIITYSSTDGDQKDGMFLP